jgi:hypothetical protein
MVACSAGGGPIGVAPDAKSIAAKIYDNSGKTTVSVIHQAFQWSSIPTETRPPRTRPTWSTRGGASALPARATSPFSAISGARQAAQDRVELRSGIADGLARAGQLEEYVAARPLGDSSEQREEPPAPCPKKKIPSSAGPASPAAAGTR